jgi:4-amino-4-deoxy-L-arabinose transferase-like glycosyltransferase
LKNLPKLNPKTKNIFVSLLIIIAIGLFLRAYRISYQCMWTDEQYTAAMVTQSFQQIWTQLMVSDYTPPLFYWIDHISVTLLGVSNFAFRLPSVICGILLIPTMYYVGKTYNNYQTGIYCAALTTILFPFTYYSQFARAYSMSMLCFALLLVFGIRILKGDIHLQTFCIYGILAGITVWVHLYAFIPVVLLTIIVIYENRFRLKHCAVLLTVYTLILLPLYQMPFTLFAQRVNSYGSVPYGLHVSQLIATIPVEFFNTAFPIIFLLLVFGINCDRKNKLMWELFAVGMLTVISGCILCGFTIFYARYLLTVSIIFVLLASIALPDIFNSDNTINIRNAGFILLLFSIIFIFQYPEFIAQYTTQKYIC